MTTMIKEGYVDLYIGKDARVFMNVLNEEKISRDNYYLALRVLNVLCDLEITDETDAMNFTNACYHKKELTYSGNGIQGEFAEVQGDTVVIRRASIGPHEMLQVYKNGILQKEGDDYEKQ